MRAGCHMDQVCAEAWAHTAPSRPKVPLKLFLRLPIVVENSSAFRKGMATSFYPRIAPALHSPVQMGDVRIFFLSVRPHGPIPDRVDQGGPEGGTNKSGNVALRRRATLFTGQEVKENTCARIPCENGAAKPPRWAPVAPGGCSRSVATWQEMSRSTLPFRKNGWREKISRSSRDQKQVQPHFYPPLIRECSPALELEFTQTKRLKNRLILNVNAEALTLRSCCWEALTLRSCC